MSSVLGQLTEFVARKLGLNFPPERWRDLERALEPVAAEMGFAGVESYAQWLVRAPLSQAELDALAARLTVGETYFFREPRAFDVLREHVVPELIEKRGRGPGRLRVWSAGCCTGEEAYSLAMFFRRFCPALHDWKISILGTDINPHFLRKAREGVYRNWSFRGAPAWLQSEYFIRRAADEFELRPEIRRLVDFEQLNLAEDSYPALHNRTNGLDLIFCRNVLMYFSPDQAQRAIDGFSRALVNGGHLVVGVCEVSTRLCPQLRPRAFPEITIYQKPEPAGRVRSVAPAASDAGGVIAASLPELAAAPREESAGLPLSPAAVDGTELLAEAAEHFRLGDYGSSVDALQKLLARGPLDVDAAMLLARAEANQGHLAEALRWIERALVVDKLRPALHFLQASVLQEQNEWALAAEALERALYLDPDYVLAHVTLAELADRGGRAEKATRHRTQALRWLRRQPAEAVIPETEGLTAGRLAAIVEAMQLENAVP